MIQPESGCESIRKGYKLTRVLNIQGKNCLAPSSLVLGLLMLLIERGAIVEWLESLGYGLESNPKVCDGARLHCLTTEN